METIEEMLIKVMGTENAAKFIILAERRVKWLLLLLYLNRNLRLSIRQAMRLTGMSYDSLRHALRYLGGIPDPRTRRLGRRSLITSNTVEPLVSLEELSPNEKYIVLTQHGRRFVESIRNFIVYVALRYGTVDVRRDYAVTEASVIKQITEQGFEDPYKVLHRLVSWERVRYFFVKRFPSALPILKPELYGFIEVRLRVGNTKIELYYVPESLGITSS